MKAIALFLCMMQSMAVLADDMPVVKYFVQVEMQEAKDRMIEGDLDPYEYSYFYGRYCALEEVLEFIKKPKKEIN